jgi:hypothetical protein
LESGRDVTAKILFELFNMTVPGGTGIAPCARHLCSTGHDLGYEAESLLHSYRPIDTRDAVLAELGFFDARTSQCRREGASTPSRKSTFNEPKLARTNTSNQAESPKNEGFSEFFTGDVLKFVSRKRMARPVCK